MFCRVYRSQLIILYSNHAYHEKQQQKRMQKGHIQPDETQKRVRVGITEQTIFKEIIKFSLIPITMPSNSRPKAHILLTSHHNIYKLPNLFTLQQSPTSQSLIQEALISVSLKIQHRLPFPLLTKVRHHPHLHCLFVLLNTGQLAVLNEDLQLVDTPTLLPCDPQDSLKHCLDFEMWEADRRYNPGKHRICYFVFMFSDSIQWHEVQVSSNHTLTKHKQLYKFTMKTVSKQILAEVRHPQRLTLDRSLGGQALVISCNCSRSIHFWVIDSKSSKVIENTKLGSKTLDQQVVCDARVSIEQQRILVGLASGEIRAFHLKTHSFSQKRQIFSIQVSQSAILGLRFLPHSKKLIIYSKGGLYIVELHELSVQQYFKAGDYSQVQFMNDGYMVGLGERPQSIYNNQEDSEGEETVFKSLVLNRLNFNYRQVHEHSSQVVSFYHSSHDLIELADNSLLVSHLQQSPSHLIKQTYLPPKCLSVHSMARNIYQTSFEEYWILTNQSEVYKYQISKDGSAQVSGIVELKKFIDNFNNQFSYKVVQLCFLKWVTSLEFDSETVTQEHAPSTQTVEQVKPVCLAMSSGEILIVRLACLSKIVMRIKLFSNPITQMTEVIPYRAVKGYGVVVSQSKKEQRIVMTLISSSVPPADLFAFKVQGEWIRPLFQSLFAIVNKGNFNLYNFRCSQPERGIDCFRQDHSTPVLNGNPSITTLEYQPQEGKLLSGYQMGQVIVWGLQLTEMGQMSLSCRFILENSQESPLELTWFKGQQIYMNMGRYIVAYAVPTFDSSEQDQQSGKSNNKVSRFGSLDKQFALGTHSKFTLKQPFKSKQFKKSHISPRTNNQSSYDIELNSQTFESRASKQRHSVSALLSKQEPLKLPAIGQLNFKERKKRAASVSKIGTAGNKYEMMFHFPATSLYRSLIGRSIIN